MLSTPLLVCCTAAWTHTHPGCLILCVASARLCLRSAMESSFLDELRGAIEEYRSNLKDVEEQLELAPSNELSEVCVCVSVCMCLC